MELLQLRKFCHASRSGSFARTAEHFGVPPSDISQTVRRLEEELGVRLFDRKANAVTLNRRGEVHICVNCNRRIVMDAVEQFRRRWSAVSIHTRTFCDPTAEQFDLIVSADDDTLTGYHRQKLLSEQLAIAVSRSSPYDRWDGALSSLADAPFITMGEGTSLCRLTRDLCREAGFTPHIAVQSDDPYYVRKCVELGLGVALVPLFSWQGQFGDGVALHPLPQQRDTWLYTAPDRYLPLCARRFCDLLMEVCRTEE